MFEFRFFEIYRSTEYLELLLDGILISSGLTISAGIIGFILAFILAAFRYWKIFGLSFLSACYVQLEAATALNLKTITIFRKIILPQTIIKMFPSLSSDFSYISPTNIIQTETGSAQPNKEFLTFFNMASD